MARSRFARSGHQRRFFDADNQATGLVIADGDAYGYSYRGFGGMFFVRDDAPDLVWLALEGYRPDPRISQAVQGYPMLVSQGQAIDSFPEDGKRNRRSFVGIDRAGRVILGVTTAPVWTLTELAGFLAGRSGLEVDRAVNLDGGASSGLWVSGVPEVMLVDSFDPVPAVITIDAR